MVRSPVFGEATPISVGIAGKTKKKRSHYRKIQRTSGSNELKLSAQTPVDHMNILAKPHPGHTPSCGYHRLKKREKNANLAMGVVGSSPTTLVTPTSPSPPPPPQLTTIQVKDPMCSKKGKSYYEKKTKKNQFKKFF